MPEEREQQDKLLITRFSIFAVIVAVISTVIVSFVYRNSGVVKYNTLYIIASVFIGIVIIAYSCASSKKVFSTPHKLVTASILYMFPGLLLLVTEDFINFPFWMLGGVLISALVDVNLGMFVSYFYVLQAAHLQNNTLKGLIITVVCVSALCVFVKFIKDFSTMLYCMVSMAALTLICSLLLNKFIIHDSFNTVSLSLIITFLIIVFVTFLLKKFLGNILESSVLPSNVPAEPLTDSSAGFKYLNEVAEETNNVSYEGSEGPVASGNSSADVIEQALNNAIDELPVSDESVKQYCDESAELILKLKESKRTAYLHSLRVSRLAGKCADGLPNVDSDLVRAGALYHEIGKIKAGEVYSNTINIAKENDFPERLIECLKGCAKHTANGVFSCESALIIIADTVVTTYYFIKSTNGTVFPEKLVDSVIGKEVTQGRFNSSGLSLKDCNYIREYFVDTINKLENK